MTEQQKWIREQAYQRWRLHYLTGAACAPQQKETGDGSKALD